MKAEVGDRIVVEAEKVGQSTRTGVVEEVLAPEPPRLRVRWDDGRSTKVRQLRPMGKRGHDCRLACTSRLSGAGRPPAPRRRRLRATHTRSCGPTLRRSSVVGASRSGRDSEHRMVGRDPLKFLGSRVWPYPVEELSDLPLPAAQVRTQDRLLLRVRHFDSSKVFAAIAE